MVRVREEYNTDRTEEIMHVSAYPTEKTKYEIYCDMCGEAFFVDEFTFEKVSHALREGFDNPFLCENCRDELGEFAYSER